MNLFRKPKIDPDDGKPEVRWVMVFGENGRQLAEKTFRPPVRGIQAAIGQALAAARAVEEANSPPPDPDAYTIIKL